jgi:hypothetical protein
MPSWDPASLDPDALIAEAVERAGHLDFGDESFREGLDALTQALESEANLNATGRGTQHARIVESLVTRLRVEGYFARYPEILEEDLGDPIVIVGLMRTGTTRLHRLLGAGPAFQVAKWWEVRYPAPFPGSDWRRDDPRVAAAREEVRLTLEAVPVLASVHPWDADGADEEIMLLEHAFQSWVPESGAHVPSYSRWLDAQDLTAAYRYLARLLRFIQWQKKQSGRWREAGADGPARLILKSPFHLAYVGDLLRVFPGARVIQTHRDPLDTIPSGASMYRSLRALNTDEVDPRLCGACVRDRFAWALDRCMRSREKLSADRFLDVDYHRVGGDPIGEARRVYEWSGIEISPDAESAMRRWMQDNARERRAAHDYSLEEFGFTPEGLAADFAEYRERYILPHS